MCAVIVQGHFVIIIMIIIIADIITIIIISSIITFALIINMHHSFHVRPAFGTTQVLHSEFTWTVRMRSLWSVST